MVAVEEGGKVAVALLTTVYAAADDIGHHIGAQQTEQDVLVAVVVPEGGVGIVAEVATHDFAASVAVLAVDVTAQRGPQQ